MNAAVSHALPDRPACVTGQLATQLDPAAGGTGSHTEPLRRMNTKAATALSLHGVQAVGEGAMGTRRIRGLRT